MSKYTVDSVEDGNRHLNDLLSVMGDIQFNLRPDRTDSRLDSLLWIAIHMSEGIQSRIEDDGQLRRAKSEGDRK